MKTVIKVENLSKKFRIGLLLKDGETLRDVIGNLIKYPFLKKDENLEAKTLWALQNINFEVAEGDTFGIIGGNGAGKSTLLKILSRIIKPTSGRAILNGKVGSLLEIGTGFHQDLTGRENIFLNGAVLGMPRREVERKFDEIVDFSGLEKFLETPVKFYSTGMYARLAFAVAAHLEPDILIIDEVLAVGDAAFQAKCLGKMGKVAESGRTVLFVSHDPNAMIKLCNKGIYLEKGQIKSMGNMTDLMEQYQFDYLPTETKFSRKYEDINDEEARFIKWQVLGSRSQEPYSIITKEKVTFEFLFVSKKEKFEIDFRFSLLNEEGTLILSSLKRTEIKKGNYILSWICELPLKSGNYKVKVKAFDNTDEVVFDEWNCDPDLVVFNQELDHTKDQFQGVLNIGTQFNISSVQ